LTSEGPGGKADYKEQTLTEKRKLLLTINNQSQMTPEGKEEGKTSKLQHMTNLPARTVM